MTCKHARLVIALLRGCLSTNKVHAGSAQPGELHLLSRGGGTLLQAKFSGRPEVAFQCQLMPDTVCSMLHRIPSLTSARSCLFEVLLIQRVCLGRASPKRVCPAY